MDSTALAYIQRHHGRWASTARLRSLVCFGSVVHNRFEARAHDRVQRCPRLAILRKHDLRLQPAGASALHVRQARVYLLPARECLPAPHTSAARTSAIQLQTKNVAAAPSISTHIMDWVTELIKSERVELKRGKCQAGDLALDDHRQIRQAYHATIWYRVQMGETLNRGRGRQDRQS